MPASYGSLPFNEQIDYFRNKLNVPSERWADIWQHQHNQAFTIAGALKDDLLNDFRRAVDRAIAEGKSLTWFKSEFNNIVAKHGWEHTGNADWRAHVIYDTNMRQSYNAGRFEQLQHFDFWEYKHGDSRMPRPHHLSWDGTILPKTHAWWQTHFPQNGWGCKCKVFGRTGKSLQRQNKTVKLPPKDELKEWTDKVTGEVHKIPVGIDPGFDYAPQKSAVSKQTEQLAKVKAEPYQPPARIVPTAFSTVPTTNIHGLNQKLSEFKTAKPQIDQLSEFINKHDTKTLFLRTADMGFRSRGSNAIADDVKAYLKTDSRWPQTMYTIRNASQVNGFTSRMHNHVVVKTKAGQSFAKANVNEVINAVEAAIISKQQGHAVFSLSSILRSFSDGKHNNGMLMTWAHEIGHQVHFKAGMPTVPSALRGALTSYGNTNDAEWHAEHFAAWLFNRKALAKWNKALAEYFDQLIKQAMTR